MIVNISDYSTTCSDLLRIKTNKLTEFHPLTPALRQVMWVCLMPIFNQFGSKASKRTRHHKSPGLFIPLLS